MEKKCENCKKNKIESKERDVCQDCVNMVLAQAGRKDLI